MMEAPNDILVLRGGALGDFVLTLPVFSALRKRCPGIRIGCMGYPRLTALAKAAGLIDEEFSLDASDAARLFAPDTVLSEDRQRRLARYAAALSFLHDPDLIVRQNLVRAGIDQVIVHSPLVETGHATDHFLSALAKMGIPAQENSAPCLKFPGRVNERGRQRLKSAADQAILLHPGSGSAKKNWPLAKFVALFEGLHHLNLPAAFVVGEAEQAVTSDLSQAVPGAPIVSEPDIVSLAALLASARAYVGNDSGVTHLAAAVEVPVVALFGPTDAAVWGPRGSNVRIINATQPTTESLAEVEVETVERAILAAVR